MARQVKRGRTVKKPRSVKKVYSTRGKNPNVKNNWVFKNGRFLKNGIVVIRFTNKTKSARFEEKKVVIPSRGSLEITYSTYANNYEKFLVKRTAKVLDSYRKYKNRLTN